MSFSIRPKSATVKSYDMTLFTEQGDLNCPLLREMVMYFGREQKGLAIKYYQTWRLKAQDQAPSPLLELAASYLYASCPNSFKILLWKNTQHYSSLSTLSNIFHCEWFTIRPTLCNHDWKKVGASNARWRINIIHPSNKSLCEPLKYFLASPDSGISTSANWYLH